MENTKDLNYYKNNCEEDYIKTPISVLRYITELEQSNKELLEALEECHSFLKRVQAPATPALFLSQSISQLIQKHKL